VLVFEYHNDGDIWGINMVTIMMVVRMVIGGNDGNNHGDNKW
jgi:hypothetical protein